ncbi:MAG: hypothetical protein ACLFQW_11035, partial [Spirochaetaceae bacterium]
LSPAAGIEAEMAPGFPAARSKPGEEAGERPLQRKARSRRRAGLRREPPYRPIPPAPGRVDFIFQIL